MIYKNFNDIDIDNRMGVSPVGKDTELIAKHAEKLMPKSVLEVGVGTGFIPIYLKTRGFNCDGIDINPIAIDCAEKNAKKNNIKVNFYISDLFENVQGKFDLIIFNVPYGNAKHGFLAKYLEVLKSFLPKENPIIAKPFFLLVKKQRIQLINRFLEESVGFLEKKAKVIMLLDASELWLIEKYSFVIVDRWGDNGRIILVSLEFER